MNVILAISAVTIVILLVMIAYDYAKKSKTQKASLSKYSFASGYAAYKPIIQVKHHKN